VGTEKQTHHRLDIMRRSKNTLETFTNGKPVANYNEFRTKETLPTSPVCSFAGHLLE
jgi:hypothetical protein